MDLLFGTGNTTETDLFRLNDYKFVCSLIKNIVHRGTKFHQHCDHVKSMFTRLVILS